MAREKTAEFILPFDALEAAAERANTEERSLTDVTVALLRDYAAGRTWLNLPGGDGPSAPMRDLSECVDRFGNIRVMVEIGGGLGTGEAQVTGASGRPAAVARFLRELANNVERSATQQDGTRGH